MSALRLLPWQSEPKLVTVPVPEPGPGGGPLLGRLSASRCARPVDAYRRLGRGEVYGRAVVTPGAGSKPDVASVTGLEDRRNLESSAQLIRNL
jgi:hypothetical protein